MAPTSSQIALFSSAAVATAVLGYAVYFDHRRRHDPIFRKKLAKQNRAAAKVSASKDASPSAQLLEGLKAILAESQPTDPSRREEYLMENLTIAEQLANKGPSFYVPAAIAFYKAVKVFPQPTQILQVIQQSQPPQIFAYIMELATLEMAQTMKQAPASRDPRDMQDDDPLLTEVVTQAIEDKAPSTKPADDVVSLSDVESSGSITESYDHVDNIKSSIASLDDVEKLDNVAEETAETSQNDEEVVAAVAEAVEAPAETPAEVTAEQQTSEATEEDADPAEQPLEAPAESAVPTTDNQ